MITFQKIEDRFEFHMLSVDELVAFDRIILDTCIGHIDSLNERLKGGPFKISNPTYLAEGTLKAIKNVRENDSLRANYLSMFNSCLVLQVSYFTSIIDDIFRHATSRLFISNQRPDLNFEVLRKKNEINFQNMPSIIKTYKKFLDIEIKNDTICNTIILAQCSRHAMVHSLGIADEKFISQTNVAKPRDIKQDFVLDQKIQFSSSELGFIKYAMQSFIATLIDSIKSKYKIE